jgi:hypothetical protein
MLHLKRLEELQQKLHNDAKLSSSFSVPNSLNKLSEEGSSIILEHSKGLINKLKEENDEENYCDDEEDFGLKLKGDPLGVSESRLRRTHSLASAETFYSAMTNLSPE